MAQPMKISVIAASRKNSKWLAQFIFGYFTHTHDLANTELLVMHSAHDTWNQDLIQFFSDRVTFVPENYHLGRKGHHVYLNELAKLATGDWIIELCEDMAFITPEWDRILREKIICPPSTIAMLRPRFKPHDGAMAHLVSRGYLEAAGNLAESWSVDSWINKVFEKACPGRATEIKEVYFYDYTHDPRNYFDASEMNVEIDAARADQMPTWGVPSTDALLAETVERVKSYLARGR